MSLCAGIGYPLSHSEMCVFVCAGIECALSHSHACEYVCAGIDPESQGAMCVLV